jgi:hypothetical protein
LKYRSMIAFSLSSLVKITVIDFYLIKGTISNVLCYLCYQLCYYCYRHVTSITLCFNWDMAMYSS